jgi:hypothetical protein
MGAARALGRVSERHHSAAMSGVLTWWFVGGRGARRVGFPVILRSGPCATYGTVGYVGVGKDPAQQEEW